MAKNLRQLSRERFEEEVARELGIDLSQADRVPGAGPGQSKHDLKDPVDNADQD